MNFSGEVSDAAFYYDMEQSFLCDRDICKTYGISNYVRFKDDIYMNGDRAISDTYPFLLKPYADTLKDPKRLITLVNGRLIVGKYKCWIWKYIKDLAGK